MGTLNENINAVRTIFGDIKTALTQKGVNVPVSALPSQYASLIDGISAGGVIDAQTDWSYMFQNGVRKSILANSRLDTSHVTNFSHFADGTSSLTWQIAYPLDLSSATDTSYMFNDCLYLSGVTLTNINRIRDATHMFRRCLTLPGVDLGDTSSITSAQNMFYNCQQIVFPNTVDLSGATAVTNAFNGAGKIADENILRIRLAPTLAGTNSAVFKESRFTEIHILSNTVFAGASEMFKGNTRLKTVTGFNISNTTTNYASSYQPFYNCTSLVTLEMSGSIKINFDLSACTALSHQSLLNVMNALDAGVSGKTLTIGSTNLAKLTAEEQAIATVKGWTLA